MRISKKMFSLAYAALMCMFSQVEAIFLISTENMRVGKFSYGPPPTIFSWGEGCKVQVGNFCAFAGGVEIFVGGDHRIDWITTYPFMSFGDYWPNGRGISGHPKTKGDVIIGNDAWIGHDAFILSGVTIGNGAVVGAKSVVTKNVPPYAIVAGNPARIVKYRFDEDTIVKLLTIAWWNWDSNEINEAIPFLLSSDIQKFIQYCNSRGKL
jgi:acetyltransferase-like isoleucine patch superfamily enzyme